ncbi:hypothetical protein ACOCIZ_18390 [Acinetobacter baumannii]|uniref:hypothetical protein n=1 Tax=Acinetobacter baumannii TaxID=470 RepID=UPI0022A55DD6|nr:hypothetical protein [Acinetobacter baumannii]HCW5918726.1 hypothetical protein [Acinetobacter baumannii]
MLFAVAQQLQKMQPKGSRWTLDLQRRRSATLRDSLTGQSLTAVWHWDATTA